MVEWKKDSTRVGKRKNPRVGLVADKSKSNKPQERGGKKHTIPKRGGGPTLIHRLLSRASEEGLLSRESEDGAEEGGPTTSCGPTALITNMAGGGG